MLPAHLDYVVNKHIGRLACVEAPRDYVDPH